MTASMNKWEGIKYWKPMKHSGLIKQSVSPTWPCAVAFRADLSIYVKYSYSTALLISLSSIMTKNFQIHLSFVYFFFPFQPWVMLCMIEWGRISLQNKRGLSTKILKDMLWFRKRTTPVCPHLLPLLLKSLCLIELSEILILTEIK